MQPQHSGAMRGLGIAAIALSSVSLLVCLLGAVLLVVASSALDASTMESLAYEMSRYGGYGYGHDYYGFGYGGENMATVLSLTFVLAGVTLGWESLTCVVSLVASVMVFRAANDSARLGKVFGWSLAGAVASLLGGRLVTMGVLIVAAVFATRDRSAIQNAYWQANGTPVTVTGEASAQQAAPSVDSASVRQQAAPARAYPQPSAAYTQAYGQPAAAPAVQVPAAQPGQGGGVEQPAKVDQPAGEDK